MVSKIVLAITIAVSAQAIEVNKQIECLAKNIYFEARSSNLADMAAVTDVVLNRVYSKDYPNTICKVVHQSRRWQGHVIRNKCQFSWYCDGKTDEPKDTDAWERAKILAFQFYNYDMFRGITEGATMYHATYVKPFWVNRFNLIGTIGKHKYYRKVKNAIKIKLN